MAGSRSKTKRNLEIDFNPSLREEGIFDELDKYLEKLGEKIATEEDKALLTTLMVIIYREMKKDPKFLRQLLDYLGFAMVIERKPVPSKKGIAFETRYRIGRSK